MTETNKPLRTLRLGLMQAAIWRNQRENGTYFSVTFERLYKDGDSKWQGTGSFGRDDLLLLAKLADQTHTVVMELLTAEREQGKAEGRGGGRVDDEANQDSPRSGPSNGMGGGKAKMAARSR